MNEPAHRDRPVVDTRREQLEAWLRNDLGLTVLDSRPASVDASFRRYFRVWLPQRTAIATDAPPQHENCEQFVYVARLLRDAGLRPPDVLRQDIARGFLLLEDLGPKTYLDILDDDNADDLYNAAVDALVRWQAASRPGVLPPYDEALLRRELSLFPEWYAGRHLGQLLSPAQQRLWERLCKRLVRAALAQPKVFVHRDFMPRNLIPGDEAPGIIDFQDAVLGPITYDLAALLRDAFISWSPAHEGRWIVRYRERAQAEGLPVAIDPAVFRRDWDWMGLQRHLKVLGLYARLCYRDGKPQYLSEIPRFLGYVRAEAEPYPELHGLLELLDDLPTAAGRADSR